VLYCGTVVLWCCGTVVLYGSTVETLGTAVTAFPGAESNPCLATVPHACWADEHSTHR
jgi:hypothetical protein